MNHPNYPTRIAVYMDILGFKRDVLLVDTYPGLFGTHERLLGRIADCFGDVQRRRAAGSAQHDVRMTYASDSIFVSLADEPGALLHGIALAAFLVQAVVRSGYLVRGAITIGRLRHTDLILWGRAFVEAVEMEQHVVRTPRIALRADVAQRVSEELRQRSATVDQFIRDRGDGPFVHVLGGTWPFLKEMRSKKESGIYDTDGVAEMYEAMRASLPIRYNDAPDVRARDKLRWFAGYVNDTIKEQNLNSAWRVVLPEPLFAWRCCWPWRKKIPRLL